MWQKFKFDNSKVYAAQSGPVQFWIEKQANIWQVAKKHTDDFSSGSRHPTPVNALPDDVNWSFHVADKQNQLHILPATPDRALVVKPAKSFAVLPGMNLTIHIIFPVWIQLYASVVKSESLVLEFPAVELSSTWFGEPDNGELSYSYPGDIYFSLDPDMVQDYQALCPIKIKNESDTTLDFQRLSVPVNQLNLYSNQTYLCANELQVRFRGEEQSSEVQITSGAPSVFEGLKQLNKARISTSSNILKKSFSFFKSIAES